VPTLLALLGPEQADLKVTLAAYGAALTGWKEGDAPASEAVVHGLGELVGIVEAQAAEISARQGDHTYARARLKVDRLRELMDDRAMAASTLAELDGMSQELTLQATFISGEIRAKIQALLDGLQAPLNRIFTAIQGTRAVPIRLELPAEEDTNQHRLGIVIDFAENRTGVQPGGYLSDSQIHSVALALRLAAILRFNPAAPIVALDDVVTSYDADHRRRLAGLIATELSGCQVIVTTHDRRFFDYLKDQMDERHWQFTSIIHLDPQTGPRFNEDKVSEEMVEPRWGAGESAANEMRRAEEEWLLTMCREFGASVRIRPLDEPYRYDRGELASAHPRRSEGGKARSTQDRWHP
jgi:hypothetical protein